MIWVLAAALLVIAAVVVLLARRARAVMPEAAFAVTTDDSGITVADPRGDRRSVTWQDLTKVTIRTTDEGPLAADVFWSFHTRDGDPALVVPGGATGESELLRALGARLAGFRHEEVIQAMGSASNATFVVWEAPG